MHLVSNWRRVLLRAWSAQLNALNVVLSTSYLWLPSFQEMLSPPQFLMLIAGISILSLVVRPIQQKSVSGSRKGMDDADK